MRSYETSRSFPMKRVMPWLLVWGLGSTGCSLILPKATPQKTDEQKAFGDTGVPAHLRTGGGAAAEGSAVAPGGNKPGSPGLNFTPREEIRFTNPDNPDAELPELTAMLAAPKAKTWEESEALARSRSGREGKPLLIWFTSTQNSPMCKALNEELFSTGDFEKWAGEKLVRLRVDATLRVTDPDMSMDEARTREINIKNYVDELKKRYKVMGHPTLILLNPSGEVIGRYVGYRRGTADTTWGLIKHGESVSTRAYASWRAGLAQKGYREWQDSQGRKVFAKLVSYNKGFLTFIEPEGARSRTHENKLCDADRAWITEQKKLHDLP